MTIYGQLIAALWLALFLYWAIVHTPSDLHGMLIAMLGSTVGQSVSWFLPLFLFAFYFVYSARREEKLMVEEFPQQYPAYMARTKMLLPLLF